MARIFLGIDGGGTKTQAAICDESGAVLGSAVAGPSGIDSVGGEIAARSIGAAVDGARRQGNLPAAPFDGVFFGMAGVTSEADRAIVRNIARQLQLGPAMAVDHDIRISLAGGLSGRPGIALIAGTGSSCYGRNEAGASWQAGGWGHWVSDEGSSYWFGCQAIRLALGTYDGRWRSSLLEPVRLRLGIERMEEVHNRLYTQAISKAELAGFAPLLMEAATSGDLLAQECIAGGSGDLAQMTAAVARKLGWGAAPCEVTLTGGLWQAGEIVLSPFRRFLAELLPAAAIVLPELSPVLGACILALQGAGVAVDGSVLQRLRSSSYP